MADTPPPREPPAGQRAPLAALLAEAVDGIVQAQRRLDEDALERVTEFVGTPHGTLSLPPLWYTLADVRLDLELAASITRLAPAGAGTGHAQARLDCALVNPAAVSLFGYAASSGLKVSLRLAPRESPGAAPPATPAAPEPPS